MNFNFSITKEINFTFLIDNIMYAKLFAEGVDNILAPPLYPDVDISALASFGRRIKLGKTSPFQDTPIKSQSCNDISELFCLSYMPGVNLGYFAGEPVPVFDEMLRRQLAVRKTVYAIIEDAN